MLVPYHQFLVSQNIVSRASDSVIEESRRFENYNFFKINSSMTIVFAAVIGAAFLF